MPNNKLLKIRHKPATNQLDLKVLFLTVLNVSLEGEADKHAILIQAAEMVEKDDGELSSHSEAAVMAPTMENLH